MSLGSLSDKDNGNPFKREFGLASRISLLGSDSAVTDSTAPESMFSINSSSVGKNGSIVDFGRRTSFAMRFDEQRRKTDVIRQKPFQPEEIVQMERISSVDEGEGPINVVNNAPINQNKVRKQNTLRHEESRENFEASEDPVELFEQKHSGSGSDRAHPALRSFHAAEEEELDPFSVKPAPNDVVAVEMIEREPISAA